MSNPTVGLPVLILVNPDSNAGVDELPATVVGVSKKGDLVDVIDVKGIRHDAVPFTDDRTAADSALDPDRENLPGNAEGTRPLSDVYEWVTAAYPVTPAAAASAPAPAPAVVVAPAPTSEPGA